MIEATIFDLDGTLVETEELKARSYARAAVELRPDLDESEVLNAFVDVVGLSRREVALTLTDRFRLETAARQRMDEFGVDTLWQAFVQVRLRIYEVLLSDPDILCQSRWMHNINLLEETRASCQKVGLATMSYCAQVQRVLTILGIQTLAPAADQGWGYVGPSGAGHFVKMVHNGIEYGLMQAYAEGFELMDHKSDLQLDLQQIAEIWRYGSVVRAWLLDLTANALAENPQLEGIAAYVPDSGEGRWTVAEAIDLNCSIPVITAALQQRFRSREAEPFGDKLLAAMRNQFGGHAIKETS